MSNVTSLDVADQQGNILCYSFYWEKTDYL